MSHDLTPAHSLGITEVVIRIVNLNRSIGNFWSRSHGWAPDRVAELLGKSRLDWQVSLSETLYLWANNDVGELSSGKLILAWANLGSLLEGTLKTFLAVYYEDYLADEPALKKSNAFDHKKMKPHEPDTLALESLKQFFSQKKILTESDQTLIELVQLRRNAIHAFQDRPIGDRIEFNSAVCSYLELVRGINRSIPYPDMALEPQEI
jgi:hypothetical protein